MNPFTDIVNSQEELSELLSKPSKLAEQKVIDFLDNQIQSFMNHTPILFMSTSNTAGQCDTSPRGDAPGFIHIIDDKHFVIPERPGNRRIDSIKNILENPHVGLLLVIPGVEETLRINGEACIIKDTQILKKMAVNNHIPTLGIGVTVHECFIHCAKAFKRSKLWGPETWPDKVTLPSPAKMLATHANSNTKDVEKALAESYSKRLY